MRYRTMTTVAVLAFLSAGVQSHAQNRGTQQRPEQVEQNAFQWGGELAAGQRVILRSINGRIQVEPSRSRTLEVVATKKWRRGDPAAVRIEATRVNGGRDVLVCARWTASTECTETSYNSGGQWPREQDTRVEFIIRLPAGSNATLNVTNGDIEVVGASGAIEAHTTNGGITAESTGGPVEAMTTNGDLRIAMMKLPARNTSYHTTNGTITLTLPEGIEAYLAARTTNGSISSDFEITTVGTISNRNLSGRIGRGGPRLELATTNGSIRIEKK